MLADEKVRKLRKKFIFYLFCLVRNEKIKKKMSLNKFIHMPLLKNNIQLK